MSRLRSLLRKQSLLRRILERARRPRLLRLLRRLRRKNLLLKLRRKRQMMMNLIILKTQSLLPSALKRK